MTIKECYDAMGADYQNTLNRFPNEAFIKKFVLKFLDDNSYANLKEAIAAGNVEEEIYIYTMQAEPTFLGTGMMNLKIDVETSDEIIFTYILKFADKDVKITNGKVVE